MIHADKPWWHRNRDSSCHVLPYACIQALKDFSKDWETILFTLNYSALNDCWSFIRFGTYVVIERDGYIHS